MQFDLDNPKNSLQYQLYKVQLVLEQIVNQVTPLLSKITESFVKNVVDPYLEYHAKTQRARIKNLKRLYKIGCLIEKRGD